ncbi:MAG TPA: helix-turn-helix transcriptional regulator [Phenylobacterium sp.]|nr:helix-turn-helix transcriptional regulator [Phenylobacterium sp.]
MDEAQQKQKVERPEFRRWRTDRNITQAEAAERLAVSKIQVGRYELPFDDPRRQIPREEVMERAFEWSGGEITPDTWYPPRLRACSPEPVQ